MLKYDQAKHAKSVLTGDWSGFTFPDTRPGSPRFADGDAAFRRTPRTKVANSDRIIAHMAKTGVLNISTGDTRPDYDGKTEGVYLNVARATDPQYTISRTDGRRNLAVTTGYSAPYGKKVRIGKDFIAQGYPMHEYSDHKMHIFDPIDQTVTEIQFIVDVSRNAFLNWVLGLFGKGGGYQCHGVTQYSVLAPSANARGSSAANIPLASTALRYDDLMAGHRQMSTMGVPAAARRPRFVPPAEDSDGKSVWADDPDAVQMGMVLRLTDEAFARLSKIAHPLELAVLECWRDYGVMVVDTAGNISFGLEPDNRIDQSKVALLKGVRLTDFSVWTL